MRKKLFILIGVSFLLKVLEPLRFPAIPMEYDYVGL